MSIRTIKQFSVLGDSISTLDGYNPKGYKVFYENENCLKSGVTELEDTWWGKVIGHFGGELLVNNSWSGSRVTKLPGYEQLFPSGCSDERTAALHINNVKPDVIVIYLGTNDWAFGAKTRNDTSILGEDSNEFFYEAYDCMLKKIKSNYPNAEIWCCTLCETYMSKRPDFKFPHKYAGTHIEEYNEIIRTVAKHNGCRLIDMYQYKTPYDSVDGTHPTASGMSTIATMMIRSMSKSEGNRVLEWEISQCDYTLMGREENVNGERKSDMLDPNLTPALDSNTLRLTIESSGMVVQFNKAIVEVGRDGKCDLLLEGKVAVSRRHATFFYENNMWFLCDNGSKNGTYLNDIPLKPGKKYRLNANDRISFAAQETVIFHKTESTSWANIDPDAKVAAILESGMVAFEKSKHNDEVSLRLIVASLAHTPLYIPVEIDMEAMLGSIDPTKLKCGDSFRPSKDVRMRFLTLKLENGFEFVPMFTSNDKANIGLSQSIIRLRPYDYLPKIIQMDKPAVINPFSESRFVLLRQMITEALLPIVQSETKSTTNMVAQFEEEYIGKIIGGKYEVRKLIGRGGYFTTYLVRSIHDGKVWAMKVCDKTSPNYSPVVRENILTEPYMMKRLNHPSIPNVIDIIEEDEALFIIREYIDGETLETIAKMYGAQSADRVVEWSKQMCNVLGYLHSQNPPLVYRDMKPHNVIETPTGTIKFIDFGIMRTYKPNQMRDTCYLGTKGYAAPEQFGGSQTDARTDIFGLGMTMFRLVTGIDPTKPPYEVKPACLIDPNIPKGLEYIISKCIRPNPAERYQSCDELMLDLNRYLSLPKKKGIIEKLFGKKI